MKPGSCPNAFTSASRGVLPVALIPGGSFGPDDVDRPSLALFRADGMGDAVMPLFSGPPGPGIVVEDVATPFSGEPCDCHELGGDGDDDLSLTFKHYWVVELLDLSSVPAGGAVEVVLQGFLDDGTIFEGRDCTQLAPAQ